MKKINTLLLRAQKILGTGGKAFTVAFIDKAGDSYRVAINLCDNAGNTETIEYTAGTEQELLARVQALANKYPPNRKAEPIIFSGEYELQD